MSEATRYTRKQFLFFEGCIFDAQSIHRIQKVEGGVAIFQVQPDKTVEKFIVKTEQSIVQLSNQLRFD